MCILTNIGDSESPELVCDECGVVFELVWHRNAIYNQPEYCPFCGSEIEEIIWSY